MNRDYTEPLHECLAVITEEVSFSGDSFGWQGHPPVPLVEELEKRGIVREEGLLGGWVKDPCFSGNPDDLPFLIYKAMDAMGMDPERGLSHKEKKVMGDYCFKLGNKKLSTNTIIFNMTSGTDCPCKDTCEVREDCYAMADENLWKTPLDYRRRQEAFWKNTTAEEFVELMPIPKYFRFSEAGDFRSQKDVDKMKKVAALLLEKGIRTYGYTNRSDLDFSDLMEVAVVNGQGFMVNNKIIIKSKPEKGDIVCPGNCRYCDLCKRDDGIDIVFPKRKRR